MGGIRASGYVSRPNSWIDPLGLVCCSEWDEKSGRWRDPTTGRYTDPPVLGSDVKNVGKQYQGRFPTSPQAPNEVMYRADSAGNITHYQVWGPDGLPAYRVDVTGATHGGVPTPHVLMYERNISPSGQVFVRAPRTVRPALPSEVP
ncbi:polymorphic toxin type 24 domain-containing protein [Methylobacterium indicum]|uniref:polymorphic toxin type 24 domain-containing protein n=1 Tax=Methylobacterium indicum TaxID=1775910 RepID=UPI003B967E5E